MTLEEIRGRLATKKTAAIEFAGVSLLVREPSLAQATLLAGSKGMAGDALMVAELLTTEAGEIVYPDAQAILALGISATVLIEKVRAELAAFASYGEEPVEPPPQPVEVLE